MFCLFEQLKNKANIYPSWKVRGTLKFFLYEIPYTSIEFLKCVDYFFSEIVQMRPNRYFQGRLYPSEYSIHKNSEEKKTIEKLTFISLSV